VDGNVEDMLAGVEKGDAYVIDANERKGKEAEGGARTDSSWRKLLAVRVTLAVARVGGKERETREQHDLLFSPLHGTSSNFCWREPIAKGASPLRLLRPRNV
jgi:hypothetical protein